MFYNLKVTFKMNLGKNICTPMLIAASFTIAKIWKQPKCPSVGEWIKKDTVHLHNGILLGHKKEHLTFKDSMNESGQHYTK